MDNELIHKGLDNEIIRDFLAKSLIKERNEGTLMDVEYIKNEIKKYQEFLIHAETYQAIKKLIESLGYKEFDVSDIIPYKKETYFPFIGTKEEFERLKEQIGKKYNIDFS